MSLRYLSVCSGIEAAAVAWHPLGWQPVAFAEIESFPCAVLAFHYPGVPNWGDMTKFREWPDAAFDVLVGGTPCQSFSVAGLRAGLADPRGNLALTYLAILDRYRPRWCCWENVPGVLSADDGGVLGAFLGGLGKLGYGFAYRVLDAQYFGLAQRRARVFVVGHLGDWRRAAAVLFERESLSGHPAPRREAGEGVTGTLSGRASAGGGLGTDFDCGGGVVPVLRERERALTASSQRLDYETETLIAQPLLAKGNSSHYDGKETFIPMQCNGTNVGVELPSLRRGNGGFTSGVPAISFDARQSDVVQYGEKSGPLDTDGHTIAVAFHENQRAEVVTNDTAGSLESGGGEHGQGYPAIQSGMQVRRLTPRECERLQGFPDDWTLIPYRGKPAADGPRYKALGNSMAVPCMRWIGERIVMMERI